jgi:cyclic beta-1,2-glucan synthetase
MSDDTPLRAELLGAERLAGVARALAAGQVWECASGRNGAALLGMLESGDRQLGAVYRRLAADVREDIPVSPAAEWILDNYYLIEEQVRLVRDELPAD